MLIDTDFAALKEELLEYVNSLRTSDTFPFALQKGSKGTFLGTIFSLWLLELLNERLPEHDLLLNKIFKLINKETGLLTNPDVLEEAFDVSKKHSYQYLELQSTYFARNILVANGYVNLPKIKFVEELINNGDVYSWIANLDWTQPWLVSNTDMFLGYFLYERSKLFGNSEQLSVAIDDYFRWHNDNQSNQDGFWGLNPDPIDRMAGAYHIFLIYEGFGKDLPLVHAAANATLNCTWRDGLYVYGGGGGACEDMDAIDILLRSELREHNNDIQRSVLNSVAVIVNSKNDDGGFSWRAVPKLKYILGLYLKGNLSKAIDLTLVRLKMLINPSHIKSTHLYSSCEAYPYRVDKSDIWSTYFRASAVAMAAKVYPEDFTSKCNWFFHNRPGLNIDPFINIKAETDV